MHASFLEGAQCVSVLKLRRFKHNDLSPREPAIERCQSQVPDAVGNSGANQQDTLIASEVCLVWTVT